APGRLRVGDEVGQVGASGSTRWRVQLRDRAVEAGHDQGRPGGVDRHVTVPAAEPVQPRGEPFGVDLDPAAAAGRRPRPRHGPTVPAAGRPLRTPQRRLGGEPELSQWTRRNPAYSSAPAASVTPSTTSALRGPGTSSCATSRAAGHAITSANAPPRAPSMATFQAASGRATSVRARNATRNRVIAATDRCPTRLVP